MSRVLFRVLVACFAVAVTTTPLLAKDLAVFGASSVSLREASVRNNFTSGSGGYDYTRLTGIDTASCDL